MKVTVFLGEAGAGPSATYKVVATSAREATMLVSNYLGQRGLSGRFDVDVLADQKVEGPARVLGPVGDNDVRARS